MLNSKVLLLLESLVEEEKRQFRGFLKSSMRIKSKDVLRLLANLEKAQKESNVRALKKEIIFAKLFPGVAYEDVKLRNLMRKLTRALEDYLLWKALQDQPLEREIRLNTIYRKRNVYSLFRKSSAKVAKELQGSAERGSRYFLEQFNLIKQGYFHPNTEKNEESVMDLREGFRCLHHFYEIERLHMEVELRNLERIYSKKYEADFFDSSTEDYAAPVLLKKVVSLMRNQDSALFFELKDLFFQKNKELNEDDRNVIFLTLLNFAIGESSKKEEQFEREAFDLYQFGLAKAFLFSDGKITGPSFFNIAVLGSKLGECIWVKAFIQKYESNITTPYKNDFLILAKSYLLFEEKKYQKLLDYLNTYEFNYSLLNLNARSLICRTYFELSILDASYKDLTENAIVSFEKTITRNKELSQNKRESYLNFLHVLKKLLKANVNQAKQNKLKNSILKFNHLYNRAWLLQKIKTGKLF